jgi:Contractile injection system tube protein
VTAPAAGDPGAKGAVLEALSPKGKVTETIPVQFNPATLRLTLANNVDGGASRGRQAQQYNGSSSTQLHVELEFDTADEGTTEAPVDVRTHISKIEQFVLPGGEGSKHAPPRVQFRWGSIVVPGVMTNLVEELDFFSADGVPLRAKATIDIKQQDPRFAALKDGAGANANSGAPPSGADATANGPGSAGTPPPSGPGARTAEALDGESAADFLARNDQPPEAWRAVAGLVGDALALAAGASIDFSASLSVGVGIGVSAGFEAGLDLSADVELGLDAGGSAGGFARSAAGGSAGGFGLSAAGGSAGGFALSAAGGLSAAVEQSAIAAATGSADAGRAAFGLPVAATPASATPSAPLARPLAAAADPRTPGSAVAQPRPLPPRADPRASGYGRGVPLRSRVTPDSGLPGGGGWVLVAPLHAPAGGYAAGSVPGASGCDCGGGCR